MSDNLLMPIATGVLALICGWQLCAGFRRGEIEWPQPLGPLSGRRADQPIRFWALVGAISLLGSICLLAMLAGTYALLAD
jgi:hypothetical protein